SVPAGFRAGVFFGAVGILFLGLLTAGIGMVIENLVGPENSVMGISLTALVGVGLLFLGGSLWLRSGTERWLLQVEEQGWFRAEAYKRSQGQRVRRGTILAILVLVGCGIY